MNRIIMELDDTEISYKQSSVLQGVLLEHIAEPYADILHMQQRHPYSQYIYKEDNQVMWCINTLDDEAREQIIAPLSNDDFKEFIMKKQNKTVHILNKTQIEKKQQDMVKEFYSVPPQHMFHIELLTAASFKQRGKYILYPDMRLFYQSLMNKYSAISDDMEMMDEDILNMLADSSEIIKYRLRTVGFPLEGVIIPAFIGDFTVKINGADTMAAYARMLFRFGEYAGVGVKTAMGMGAFKMTEGGRYNSER